jgi:hypothetical protein
LQPKLLCGRFLLHLERLRISCMTIPSGNSGRDYQLCEMSLTAIYEHSHLLGTQLFIGVVTG